MVDNVKYKDQLLAIIVCGDFCKPGIHFFTPWNLSQQLAYMNHPAGKVIDPHLHNPLPREVTFTQDVLFLRRGTPG